MPVWNPIRWGRTQSWVRMRELWIVLTLPCLVFLLYSIQFWEIGGIASHVERLYIELVSHTSEKSLSESIRLIYIDEQNNGTLGGFSDEIVRRKWREYHATLIKKLGEAGAAAIAFDLSFPPTSLDSKAIAANRTFADAVRFLREHHNTPVIIGYRTGENTDPDIQRVLSPDQWGAINIAGEKTDTGNSMSLRRVLIASSQGRFIAGKTDEQLITPLPLPLEILLASRHQANRLVTAGIDAGHNEVVVYENGVPAQRIRSEMNFCKAREPGCSVLAGYEWQRKAMLPVVMPYFDLTNDVPYSSVLTMRTLANDYKGKIVIIGARLSNDRISAPGGDASGSVLYGYHVHAAILSDLLSDTYPRRLSAVGELLCLYLIAVCAVLGRNYLPGTNLKVDTHVIGERAVPLGLLIILVLYVVAAAVLYHTFRLFLDVSYDFTLLFLVYFLSPKRVTPRNHVSSAETQPARVGG